MEERIVREKLRKIKKRKKDDAIEKEMKNLSLRRVCLEFLNEDDSKRQRKMRNNYPEEILSPLCVVFLFLSCYFSNILVLVKILLIPMFLIVL